MPFDLTSAKPVSFDLASAKPWGNSSSGLVDPDVPPSVTPGRPATAQEMQRAGITPSKETESPQIVPGFTLRDLLHTLEGAPETAAVGANNMLVNTVGGLKALGKYPLWPDAMASDLKQFQDAHLAVPSGENAKKLSAAVAEGLDTTPLKEKLGTSVLDATGSPILATGAHMIPDTLLTALGMRGAPANPEVTAKPAVTIETTPAGQTTARMSDKSVIDAQESGPYLKVVRADVDPAVQGNGHGTQMLKELADHADSRGLKLGSDVSVSPAQVRVYQKLKDSGYDVKQNPSNVNSETGNLVSLDPRKPVFEVSKAGAKDKTPTQMRQDAVDTLLANDVKLRTSERGEDFVNKAAGKLGRAGDTLAGGRSGFQPIQNQDFTRAVFKKAGMDLKNATVDSMLELKQEVTQKYDAAHALPLPVDQDFVFGLSELVAKAQRSPDAGVASGVEKLVDNISKNSSMVNGKPVIPAEAITKLRAELNDSWLGASGSGARNIGGEFKQLLDDAVERSATPKQAAAAKAARLQFHQMKQIEDSIVLTEHGPVVSPNKLVTTLSRKRNRNEYYYGAGDNQPLVELAKAGKMILGDKVGNSGTATRGLDVGTVFELATNPSKAVGKIASGTASILTGRAIDEANAARGTASALAKKKQIITFPDNQYPTLKNTAVPSAVVNETEEEKQRRLRAEALRK